MLKISVILFLALYCMLTMQSAVLELGHEVLHHVHNPFHEHEHTSSHTAHDHAGVAMLEHHHDEPAEHGDMDTTFSIFFLFWEAQAIDFVRPASFKRDDVIPAASVIVVPHVPATPPPLS